MDLTNERRSPGLGRRLDGRQGIEPRDLDLTSERTSAAAVRQAARPWNARAFVAAGALLSGLALPITGLLDHAAGSVASADDVGWTIAHVGLSVMFVGFCTWHIVLNRRALLRYLRAAATAEGRRRIPLPSREVGAAAAVVGAALVLVVAHALLGP